MIEEELKRLQENYDLLQSIFEKKTSIYAEYRSLIKLYDNLSDQFYIDSRSLFMKLIENKTCEIKGSLIYFEPIPEIMNHNFYSENFYIDGFNVNINSCYIGAVSSANLEDALTTFKLKCIKSKSSIISEMNELKKRLQVLEQSLVEESNV